MAFLLPCFPLSFGCRSGTCSCMFLYFEKNTHTIFKPFQIESKPGFANCPFQTTLTMPAAVSCVLNVIRPSGKVQP